MTLQALKKDHTLLMLEHNRFAAMSTGKKATLLIATSLVLLLAIEFGLRGIFALLDVQVGVHVPSKNIRPLLGYFNNPNFPVIQLNTDAPNYRPKYQLQPATDRYGFRMDSNDDPDRDLLTKGACEYRIFVFGGSTVEGRFLSSVDDTVSARLERAIQKLPAARGIEITAINAGDGGFMSQQEVAFERFIISYALKPDHVIFFNGSNDFHYWPEGRPEELTNIHPYLDELFQNIYSERRLARSASGLLRSADDFFRNLTHHSATVYALYTATEKSVTAARGLFAGASEAEATAVPPTDGRPSENMDVLLDKHVHRYLTNMDTVLSVAKPGHQVTVVFQPTLLPETTLSKEETKNREMPHEPWHTKFDYFDAKQRYYEKVRQALPELQRKNDRSGHALVIDLSDAFAAKKETDTWFGDTVHYLPAGRDVIINQLIARMEGQVIQGLSALRANGCS